MVGQHAISSSSPPGEKRPLGLPMENFRGGSAAKILPNHRAGPCRTKFRAASMDESTQDTLQTLEAFAFVGVKVDYLYQSKR